MRSNERKLLLKGAASRIPKIEHGELPAPQTPKKESLTAIFTKALRAHSVRPECRSLQIVSREPLRGGTAAL
jgi:hypothetical protein